MTILRTLFDLTLGTAERAMAALPLSSARWFALVLLIVPVLLVARIRPQTLLADAPDAARWRDLRWWAALFTLPYVLIYFWAG